MYLKKLANYLILLAYSVIYAVQSATIINFHLKLYIFASGINCTYEAYGTEKSRFGSSELGLTIEFISVRFSYEKSLDCCLPLNGPTIISSIVSNPILQEKKQNGKTAEQIIDVTPSNLGFRICCFLKLSVPCLWLDSAAFTESLRKNLVLRQNVAVPVL